ncbi:SDR family oxidoreductase [Marivita sp. XM-24bin2]|jgi:NAD(P)-dependent dehydrogenase (short-subunit alcohol dehydrogenase family)|uniref:SDR family oxidoreductase n=1 Tax=unclassified Marivita TaxID=2632480 RepID=UPI000D79F368|nr:SDR family oxidoreductase [Marivita sp. XM-24bin2]MCR9108483.1 SDR family oxidoreductase [Paracoccaceae bacterium]PWL33874.1 MAG: short-chain dehydrogenase [Marivita sp. XM-24bin2]
MNILITGANRGIGAALMTAAAERGDTAIGTTRSAGHDTLLRLDVRDPQSCAALAERLANTQIDLLVCNAGVYLEKGMPADNLTDTRLWADTFATNVTGVYLTAMAFLPHLKRSTAPKLAIISSQMGSSTRANGQSYIYRASKSAALNLGRNLAVDLKPHGIPVGIYHPGWVRTDMGTDAADVGTDESARGLLARFDVLSLDTTGCFEMWNGDPMPF